MRIFSVIIILEAKSCDWITCLKSTFIIIIIAVVIIIIIIIKIFQVMKELKEGDHGDPDLLNHLNKVLDESIHACRC